MILLTRTSSLPGSVATLFSARKHCVMRCEAFGGTDVVGTGVTGGIRTALGW